MYKEMNCCELKFKFNEIEDIPKEINVKKV